MKIIYEKEYNECFYEKVFLEKLQNFIGKQIKIWILQAKEDWKDQTTLIKILLGEKEYIVEPELYEYDYELTIYRLGIYEYSKDSFWKKREEAQEKVKKLMPKTQFNVAKQKFVERFSTEKSVENVQIIFDYVQSIYLCNDLKTQRVVSVKLHRGLVLEVGNEKIILLTDEAPLIEARKCNGEIDWADFSFLPPYTGCPHADQTKLLKVERQLISLDQALKGSIGSTEPQRIERYEKIIEEKFLGEIKTKAL